MQIVKAVCEISASPEAVREKFLDFSQIPNYHPDGWFKSLVPLIPEKQLVAGDKLTNTLASFKGVATVYENSETCFGWRGGIPFVFVAAHSFEFLPSTTTSGGTIFVQQEKFKGLMAFVIGKGWIARRIGLRVSSQAGFELYNRDFKAWCEGTKRREK